MDIENLPVFVSADLGRLPVEITTTPPPTPPNYTLWIIVALIVIALGAGGYFLFKQMQKKKGNKRMFKNGNEFINLRTYIENSKAKGYDENRIVSNLSKQGWNKQQINYALKNKKL